MGQDVRILDSGVLQGQVVRTARDAGILCHEVLYPAGTQLEKHGHENAFVALSLDGSYCESAGGKDFVCGPRSVVFHPPGEEHSVSIAGGTLRCFAVEIDVDEIRRRYDAPVPVSLVHDRGNSMSALMARLYAEFRLDDASPLAMQGLLLQMLALSARGDNDETPAGSPPWLRRVDEILHDRFRSRLTLEEIASEVGVPPVRVSAVYRRARQRSLAEEQRRLRIDFACDRLRQHDAPLAEIALDCGFADQPHLTRTFKRVIGMTPAQYRALFSDGG